MEKIEMSTLKDRLLSKVQLCEDGCHEFVGARSDKAYGMMKVGGRKVYAHRVAYELFIGPIPKGMHVLHKCDFRRCCNPEHLFLGSRGDNIADMVAKGRHAQEERNGKAILTAREAAEVKWLAL